jgi:AraC-like DNA-binding protein
VHAQALAGVQPAPSLEGLAEHYWPLPELPELEIVQRTRAAARWCEFHETFAVSGGLAGPPVEWRCGTRVYVRAVDRLMLTQPGDLHLDSPLRSSASWQVVRIPRVVIEREAIRRGIAGPIALRNHASVDPSAITAFAQLHCAVRRRGAADQIRSLLARCTGALLDQCDDNGAGERGIAEHVSVRLARAYMRDSLAGLCTLQELAAVGRVGTFQLIRLFRREWGMPPKKYLMHMRVARARVLLSEGVPCTEVAQETGFCDQSHLNRWFRRVYGMSPGAYARQRLATAYAKR